MESGGGDETAKLRTSTGDLGAAEMTAQRVVLMVILPSNAFALWLMLKRVCVLSNAVAEYFGGGS